MTSRTRIFLFLAALLASPMIDGVEPTDNDSPPAISFAAFPLALKRTYIFSTPGLSANEAKLDDPAPNDFPPCTTLYLEDLRKFPGGQGRYYFPSRNVLRVYRISHVETAPYKTIQPQIKSLRKLLSDRPSGVIDDNSIQRLPDYPPRNAGHCFAVKLSYIDNAWGSAICYVTQFTQDGGTPANNEELTYIVQGLSKDGGLYISADFSITHPKLPNRIQDTPERAKGDYTPDSDLLSKQSDASFTPALHKIRTWLSTLEAK